MSEFWVRRLSVGRCQLWVNIRWKWKCGLWREIEKKCYLGPSSEADLQGGISFWDSRLLQWGLRMDSPDGDCHWIEWWGSQTMFWLLGKYCGVTLTLSCCMLRIAHWWLVSPRFLWSWGYFAQLKKSYKNMEGYMLKYIKILTR